MLYTTQELASIVDGKLLQNPDSVQIYTIAIDSRYCTQGSLFVPIPGDNSDGTEYIPSAVKNGAVCCVVQNNIELLPGIAYIIVKDVVAALQKIAQNYKLNFKTPVVGVTGSVGKTTAKDIISGALASKYNVHKTQGNFNSQTGVPMTIFSLEENHEISVIEFGMDRMGEIDKTSKIASPDVACVMNIGICHIEYLKTQENIMRAKFEILNHMAPQSLVILNGDDKLLSSVYTNRELIDCKNKLLDKRVVYIGTGENSNCRAYDVKVDYDKGVVCARFEYNNSSIDVKIPGVSYHLIYPALAAFVISKEFGLNNEEFISGLQNYAHTPMRMEIFNIGQNTTVVDDTYNANPDSMKSLIDSISNWEKGNRVCILGGMRELGDKEKVSHEEIGKYVAQSKLTMCLFIGPLMRNAYEISKESSKLKALYFDTKEEAYDFLGSVNLSDTVFGIKASRYYKFEDITAFLKANC